MNRTQIMDAIDTIEQGFIEEHFVIQEKLRTKAYTPRFLKWTALAACLCIVLTLGAIFLPKLIFPNDGIEDGEDSSYALWVGNFLYHPIAVGDDVFYPEIQKLAAEPGEHTRHNILPEHLGEFIADVEGSDKLGIPDGKAYRFAAYPDYDAVIILEQEGRYTFFIAEANTINPELPTDSDTVFSVLGLPDGCASIRIEYSSVFTDKELSEKLFNCLDGKEAMSLEAIRELHYAAWCAEYGSDSGVLYGGSEFTYESTEAHLRYAEFINSTIDSLWISTEKGFNDILLSIDTTLKYFQISRNYYSLTDDEAAMISELLN